MNEITCDNPLFERLTERQQRFVMHPNVSHDPVQAAIDVGYTATTARVRAHIMRKQLLFYIRPIEAKRNAQLGVTVETIRDELVNIAHANIADYYDVVDVDGDTIKVYKDPSLLPVSMQKAIKAIDYDNIIDSEGNATQMIRSITLYDKHSALRELAEIMGMKDQKLRAPEGNVQEEQAELLELLEPKELEIVQRLYQRAANRLSNAASAKRDREAIPGTARRIEQK